MQSFFTQITKMYCIFLELDHSPKRIFTISNRAEFSIICCRFYRNLQGNIKQLIVFIKEDFPIVVLLPCYILLPCFFGFDFFSFLFSQTLSYNRNFPSLPNPVILSAAINLAEGEVTKKIDTWLEVRSLFISIFCTRNIQILM